MVRLLSNFPNNNGPHSPVIICVYKQMQNQLSVNQVLNRLKILCVSKQLKPPKFCYHLCFQKKIKPSQFCYYLCFLKTIKTSIVLLISVFTNNQYLYSSVIICGSKQSRPPQCCFHLYFQKFLTSIVLLLSVFSNNQGLHSSIFICVSKHESGDCLQRCNQWQLAI